jgi:hypothetical protein
MLQRRLFSFAFVLFSSHLVACGEGSADPASVSGSGGSAGERATTSSSFGGSAYNQCGVAAPLPVDTGQCTLARSPAITDFEDYAGSGSTAASYTFYVNAKPPAADAVLGAILHIGDGSDANGTSVISTDMVAGSGGSAYALRIAATNPTNWGGLLMFYFPGSGSQRACLDARSYSGVEFSIKGSSPSGRFGVNLGLLDTIPSADSGLCSNVNGSDCKDANLELAFPADAETWTQVRIPWSAFTPGVGSALDCIPVIGQNIARLVIQPFMKYPPPNYVLEPGPYSMVVDDLGFY